MKDSLLSYVASMLQQEVQGKWPLPVQDLQGEEFWELSSSTLMSWGRMFMKFQPGITLPLPLHFEQWTLRKPPQATHKPRLLQRDLPSSSSLSSLSSPSSLSSISLSLSLSWKSSHLTAPRNSHIWPPAIVLNSSKFHLISHIAQVTGLQRELMHHYHYVLSRFIGLSLVDFYETYKSISYLVSKLC